MIGLRDACEEDFDFLWDLKRASLKPYVRQTWGWDEERQLLWFKRSFEPGRLRIIQYNGKDVGVLHIEASAEHVLLANIAILPPYQGRGIGTAVIQRVVDDAAATGLPVTLQVLKVNPAARRLYERLGFAVTGETDTHYVLKRPVGRRLP